MQPELGLGGLEGDKGRQPCAWPAVVDSDWLVLIMCF
jgi:hypothetical protein